MKYLIDPMDLSVEEINELIDIANDIIKDRTRYQDVCRHKILATLFFEPSTRTRLSFESAMLSLGGSVLGFSSASNTSASKGESVSDTISVVSSYCDIIAMRHPKEGAPLVATRKSTVPLINAGDGGHNHPTQTLTDLLTIYREKGRLDNLTIGFCGDLKFGRTVHSLTKAMSRYKNIKFVFIAPPELKIPEYLKHDLLDAKNLDYKEVETIEEVIEDLEDGVDTHIGERGVKLSGGQKQRLSIARIFLKNPSILILDEATSALDTQTEKFIQQSFDELAEGRTTFIIAHRLATIKNADRIIVVTEDGLTEDGTHEELLAQNGAYAALYKAQFK